MFILLTIVAGVFLIVSCISWGTHISMVRDQKIPYGYAGYKDFVREFCASGLLPDKRGFKGSMFSEDRADKYHASIIQFDYRGMIIRNPIEYAMVVIFVKLYLFNFRKKAEVNWRE